MTSLTVRGTWLSVWICMALMVLARPVAAQSAVGPGPLTSTLTDTEPVAGVLTWGIFKVAPGIVVREAGYDSNMFDEAENPKEDYGGTVAPDAAVFSRSRFVQLSAYGGLELTRYRTYARENSTGHSYRGRVDFLLSRVRPFIAGGETKMRTRANGELDTRANRREDEVSGGVAFDFYEHSLVYVAAYRMRTDFENAIERGVDLSTSLDRQGTEYSAGVKSDLTPLATLTVSAGYAEDTFTHNPIRNAISKRASASLKVGPDAIFNGIISASYTDFNPVNRGSRPYRGVTGTVAIVYPVLEVGRLSLLGTRNIQYSFDLTEAYFLENTVSLSYTHRLFGNVDAQIRGGTTVFDYSFSEVAPAHRDSLDSALGGFGYNLKNQTRIAVNYEFARRRSPAFAARNYDRRRIYFSWSVAF